MTAWHEGRIPEGDPDYEVRTGGPDNEERFRQLLKKVSESNYAFVRT